MRGDAVRKDLKRFIRDGVSEILKHKEAFEEEFSEVSDRIAAGKKKMKEASKVRCLIKR
ncbi:hypothetical protein LUCIELLE_23 [Paenibacillus phage Lucielle]|uniref:Uncharacterized protein n=2 Tax=Fernvirus lucielle TaxID=2845742 RepID=A0A345AU80_9CAUD|nr:hypothetical protein HWB72_gp23 [Paenibacillus phage Lucielle]AXF39719.1 hypothetical protein LUCIELLE_23 [Paenibacillus phage Lucielle]AXF40463.1 hypothetical protein SAUDAGE_23 [Paenibacillus phage Saudage]